MFLGAFCILVKVLPSWDVQKEEQQEEQQSSIELQHASANGQPTSHVAIAMEPLQAQLRRGLEVQDTHKQASKGGFQTRRTVSTESFDG